MGTIITTPCQDDIIRLLNIGNNSIIVQPQQVIELIHLQTRGFVKVGDMSGNEWLDLMWNSGTPLLFHGHIDEDNLLTDQMRRAEYVVAEMRRRRLKTLRTMDGHGRFLTCFLMALRMAGEDVDTYTIEIYDIDHNANVWHELFFPTNVLVAEENILEEYDDLDDTMVYLNFCSIGGQVAQLEEFLQTAFGKGDNIKIMLSFSTRATTYYGEVGAFSLRLPKKYDWNYLCNRGNFFSGLVSAIKHTDTSKKRLRVDTDSIAETSDDFSNDEDVDIDIFPDEEVDVDVEVDEEVCKPKKRKNPRVIMDEDDV